MKPALLLMTADEIPIALVSQHIETGYRQPYQPWSYYFRSLFRLHNETFNIWTHLIPAIYMLYDVRAASQSVDFYGDHYSWPALGAIVTSYMVYIFSSLAHLLSSRSAFWCRLWFGLDHSSIGLHSMACLIGHMFSADSALYEQLKHYYYWIAITMAFFCAFSILCGRYSAIVRIASVNVLVNLCIALHTRRLWDFVTGNSANDPGISSLFFSNIFIYLSGITYALHFPECSYPKKFDFLFQSHQLFHIFSAISCVLNVHGMMIDLRTRRHLVERLPPISLTAIFFPCLLVLFMQPFTIWLLRRQHKAEDKILKEKYRTSRLMAPKEPAKFSKANLNEMSNCCGCSQHLE